METSKQVKPLSAFVAENSEALERLPLLDKIHIVAFVWFLVARKRLREFWQAAKYHLKIERRK